MPVPIPDSVATLIGRQIPKPVLDAEVEAVTAVYRIGLCRTPETTEAREYNLGRLARANKLLAAFDPRLIITPGSAA
ncbi:hypothetical protein [Streptomyces sp. NPDC013489]|uniref:hypothetical protein n=1 Tax=Streptomyces sp. NPDC013489 TaxID=3155606 RepID=UPI0033CF6534